MTRPKPFLNIMDNGGRRSGIDRRHFSYNAHVPERRSGQDRRSDKDRRTGVERREVIGAGITEERRTNTERKTAYKAQGDQK